MLRLLVLAALLPVACGSPEQPASQSAAAETATVSESRPAASTSPGTGVPAGRESRVVLAQAGEDATPAQSRFQLGQHYQRLSPTQPTSSGPDEVEVAEVFWYGCPHCYTFDPYLERWRAEAPDYVSFVRLPAVWNPLLQIHARAFYTAQALGKSDEMHQQFFREMHVNGNPLDSEAALEDFFGRFGVDADSFAATFDSFSVHTNIQRADELSRRYRISSVPTIVVNGKYTTNATMAGSYDALMALIDELVAMEASGG